MDSKLKEEQIVIFMFKDVFLSSDSFDKTWQPSLTNMEALCALL